MFPLSTSNYEALETGTCSVRTVSMESHIAMRFVLLVHSKRGLDDEVTV